MIFVRMWTELLAYTRPSPSAGMLFLFLQMGIGAALPVLTLYHMVRRRSPAERVLLCMVPAIIMMSVGIVEPLFFDSFLGKGFSKVDALRAFLEQPAFFWEALALCGIFLVLALGYLLLERRLGRLTLVKALLNVGLETLFALGSIVLSLDFLLGEGRLFALLGDTPLKWMVYGLYLLINKSCLYLICAVWFLLFCEREQVGDPADPIQCERWLKRRLSKGYRAMGWALALFWSLYMCALVYPLMLEGPEHRGMAVGILLLGAPMAAGFGLLLCSFFPRLLPNYRRILSWGAPELVAWQLYQELEEREPLVHTGVGFLTEHYLVVWMPFQQIYHRPLLRECTLRPMGAYRLRFADGATCRINAVYQELLRPLLDEAGISLKSGTH